MTFLGKVRSRVIRPVARFGAPILIALIAASASQADTKPSDEPVACRRTVHADVVAIDQPLMFNRLGAENINGMVFALERDVVDDSDPPKPLTEIRRALPGHAFLRPDKRPRPLVLRVAAGDCLDVTLTNLLTSTSNPREPKFLPPVAQLAQPPISAVKPFSGETDDQVADRMVGFHVQGMQLRMNIVDDSSMVGANVGGLVAPGGKAVYHLFAEHEGTFLVTSHGATFGGDSTAGNSSNGLFGAVNVEPEGARFYRSQLTEEDMRLAATTDSNHVGGKGKPLQTTPNGQPIIDYEAIYPNESPWREEGKAGLPILNMLSGDEIVHSDINAIIAGPDDDGSWTSTCPQVGAYTPVGPGEKDPFAHCPYPLEKVGRTNPSLPKRLEPFREFTVIFHDEMSKTNAFQNFYDVKVKDENGVDIDNPLAHTLKAVGDVFMVNYGSGGIGSEILANRLGVGPMHDCLGCAEEEFFLTSHAVGDPAMIVDVPANFGLDQCRPIILREKDSETTLADCSPETDKQKPTAYGRMMGSKPLVGPKATRALYPDDPSNVHHSYIGDHVKFRNLHTGKEHHIFHLHNHQWLYNPNDDNANYLDAQGIGPGSGYTYEINFGGSGNRNKSAGDAIFHCHLYPHFAQGMWELWRIHDVFEAGTPLAISKGLEKFHSTIFGLQDGLPALDPSNNRRRLRALPDGEIAAGTPIPAVVPLPGKGMAPMPGKVYVVEKHGPEPTKPGESRKTLGSVAHVDRDDKATSLSPAEREANLAETPLLHHKLNETNLKNPGFPFWIAGIEHSVGQRPPTPPLDMLPAASPVDGGWDGGLPRHALDGKAEAEAVRKSEKEPVATVNTTRYDLSKRVNIARPIWFAEDGTDLEKVAMAFHAVREHPSWSVDLNRRPNESPQEFVRNKPFVTNGGKTPVEGAPFHNPCVDDRGQVLNDNVQGQFFDGADGFKTTGRSPFTSDHPRIYKGADIQFDAVLNKAGWHYPQERIIALWEDARAIISKAKAPEPLVMRNNTFDCTKFLHTNLAPEVFELDDFEVRTSTDIIGQHIHLPKWDLTTTDGSGNGWNYEDGTLSPGAVRERIVAINKYIGRKPTDVALVRDVEGNKVFTSRYLLSGASPIVASMETLRPETHPYFPCEYPFKRPCDDKSEHPRERVQNWRGARTTLQRWFFDPVVNVAGDHRGLGLIFTHDHFGPSTHQQVGLYATVLVEPAGSEWVHAETGEKMATRADGGPTSWQALIKTGVDKKYYVGDDPAKSDLDKDGEDDSFREFYLEYSDFQHAYLPGKYVGADANGAITGRQECPNTADGAPGTATFAGPGRPAKQECVAEHDPYEPTERSYRYAINPPMKDDVSRNGGVELVQYAAGCKIGDTVFKRPCAEAITADDPGTFVVNYRNEPVGLRVLDTQKARQADGVAGDLAYALQTFDGRRHEGALRSYKIEKATFGNIDGVLRGVLNAQPREGDFIGDPNGKDGNEPTCFPRPLQVRDGAPPVPLPDSYGNVHSFCEGRTGPGAPPAAPVANDGDPFTPIMRAYDADRIRLKIQAGGDEETHNATVHGVKWLQGGSGFGFASNSGWRNSQQAGISEQFTFASPLLPFNKGAAKFGLTKSLQGKLKDDKATTAVGDDEDRKEIDIHLRNIRDYLYAIDASTEGYWNGSWGLMRAYGTQERPDLKALPNNPRVGDVANQFEMTGVAEKGVCQMSGEKSASLRTFDISAVLANDVLDNKVNAKLAPGMSEMFGRLATHNGGSQEQPEGGILNGTLVYNPRKVAIRDAEIPADPGDGAPSRSYKGHPDGVLHDPTAIMYVYTSDLEPKNPEAALTCVKNMKLDPDPARCTGEKLRLKAGAPIEPIVLRAAAGDCIEVTLRNLIGEKGAPDLRTYRQLAPVIPLHPDRPNGSVLDSNQVRTSSTVGLHAALVAYDVAEHDGTAVGLNDDSKTLARADGGSGIVKYRWYAGDISLKPAGPLVPDRARKYELVRTPVEFGGVNLMPADKIKQGQKGLVGALVIEPKGSKWTGLPDCQSGTGENCLDQVDDHQGGHGKRSTRLSTTVTMTNGHSFRDFVTVIQKGLTQVYGDGLPVEGIAAEQMVSEDTEDSATMAINYGSEPLWYRFGLLPVLPFTGAGTPEGSPPTSFRDVPNAHEAYSNGLAWKSKEDNQADETTTPTSDPSEGVKVSGDPAIPVLTAIAGEEMRMHVLQPAGNARGSVFNLHGHDWERSPYICPGLKYFELEDTCPRTGFFPTMPGFAVGSQAIGSSKMSMHLGGQDSLLPASHFDIIAPHAGGRFTVAGDYLYKDQASFGNLGGLWGILRVRPLSEIITPPEKRHD